MMMTFGKSDCKHVGFLDHFDTVVTNLNSTMLWHVKKIELFQE